MRIGTTWIGSGIIISPNTLGFTMETLVGFTQAERVPTIIGFIFLAMVGRGRTAIPFHIFIHRSIQIGISTICRVLNLGGSKDFRTKRGFGGGGIFRVDL